MIFLKAFIIVQLLTEVSVLQLQICDVLGVSSTSGEPVEVICILLIVSFLGELRLHLLEIHHVVQLLRSTLVMKNVLPSHLLCRALELRILRGVVVIKLAVLVCAEDLHLACLSCHTSVC